ncbi:MAG: cell envelope integrity protein TolA, partial [Alphaproteobacteria bacterium]|nr:cell envelope integrity protein TolA [Alphaproteobacteria bacterium]
KPPDQPPPKKQANQDFAALLNKHTAPPKTPPNAKVGPRTVQGIGAANAMTADLADALKSQIYQCWSPPVGAPNANDLVVDFDVAMNPDGSIARATSDAVSSGNSYTRAAAEAARRAIFQCQPYRLPQDRYSQWREINPLRFDPRQMMNQ